VVVRHLQFLKFEILKAGTVQRNNLRHSAKFYGDGLVGPYNKIQHNTIRYNAKRIYNASISPGKKEWREIRLLLGVISIRARIKFACKVTFKTIHKSCSTAAKRQVTPDLWSSNRKCFVSHDERRVRTAKQQLVRRSQ